MNTAKIVEEWEKDGEIDKTDLEGECIKALKLHTKYTSYLYTARRKYIEAKNSYFAARGFRTDWYNGTATREEMYEYEVDDIYLGDKVTKSEMNNKLETDVWLMKYRDVYDKMQVRLDILNQIITSVNSRNWVLKTILDNRRFNAGLNN